MKTIKQSLSVMAPPHEVYEILMDSKKHSKLTGAEAEISREVGGSFSVYDGWATGTNVELKPDSKIVQSWRADIECWPENHLSEITITLKKSGDGTKLGFVQSGVPDECYEELKQGWTDFYWEPLRRMFENP